MDNQHPDLLEDIFANHYSEFREILEAPQEQQMAWARSIQDRSLSGRIPSLLANSNFLVVKGDSKTIRLKHGLKHFFQ
ncbi:MAG: hypothetical protein U5K69_28575 [Balneolaceae bacterium]|nr:hypothetical protein [Balneolaceae bacterium]